MDGSGALERIREYLVARRAVLWTPGVALAITDTRRALGSVADGWAKLERRIPVGSHHRFQIGSISKGFTRWRSSSSTRRVGSTSMLP